MMQFEGAIYSLFQEFPEALRFQKIFQASHQIRVFHCTVGATSGAEAGLKLMTFDFVLHIFEEFLLTGLYVLQGHLIGVMLLSFFLHSFPYASANEKGNPGHGLFGFSGPLHGRFSSWRAQETLD
jgi:hypothetical protein